MIVIEQIKAGRALLNWSQDELAAKSGVSRPAINNLERNIVTPRVETVNAIQKALEEGGVEFTERCGVRLRGEAVKVKVYEGKESLFRLYNDIIETLRDLPKPEVLVSGVDERKFLEQDEKRFRKITAKMRKLGIKSKLIIRKGDTFLVDPVSFYRAVPDAIFNQVPYLVYANKYAIISWGKNTKIVVIDDPQIAEDHRKQFYKHWNDGSEPRK